MSDRCYVEITIAESDIPELETIVGKVEYKAENGIADVTEEEANGAWGEELYKLAGKGVPFYGWNGRGDEYGSGSFCGAGGEYYGVDTIENEYVNRFQDGQPQPWSIKNLRQYEEALDAAIQLIAKRAKHGKRG